MATPPLHEEPTAIHAMPAELNDSGFRLLVVREFRSPDAPPAFALVGQYLLRTPQRLNRHGISFALTFRPEVMAALSEDLGRPSLRQDEGPARRNPRWPVLTWSSVPRLWADGTTTIEWCADAAFPEPAAWALFRARFADRLDGRLEYQLELPLEQPAIPPQEPPLEQGASLTGDPA